MDFERDKSTAEREALSRFKAAIVLFGLGCGFGAVMGVSWLMGGIAGTGILFVFATGFILGWVFKIRGEWEGG